VIVFMNKKLNSSGFTLVEAVVGGLLLTICSLMLISGFIASLIYVRSGTEIKRKGLEVSSVIEGAVNTNPAITESTTANGILSYQIGSTQYQINGSYLSASETEDNVGFIIFTSNTP